MANPPIQTLSLASSSDTANGFIFSHPARQSAQQQAPRTPHKPAWPKDVALQTPPSKSLVSRQKNNSTLSSPRPRPPSTLPAPPEDHTFLPTTRHALELALGKASLNRHEILLQQDKKHTQDYIAQLQDAVKQKNSIAPSMQETLLRREITMWKAKAQEMDESAKTEIQLLRECNGRMEDEMIAIRAVAQGLKGENECLREEIQKCRREEDEGRILLTEGPEHGKEELQRLLGSVVEENEGLKAEVKNLKEEVKGLRGVAKGQGGEVREGEGSKDSKVKKRRVKNEKRRARDRKRREQVLAKENMELAAKLAEVKKKKSGAREEVLEVENGILEGSEESEEDEERVHLKNEAVSGEKRQSKKRKRGKKGKKATK